MYDNTNGNYVLLIDGQRRMADEVLSKLPAEKLLVNF